MAVGRIRCFTALPEPQAKIVARPALFFWTGQAIYTALRTATALTDGVMFSSLHPRVGAGRTRRCTILRAGQTEEIRIAISSLTPTVISTALLPLVAARRASVSSGRPCRNGKFALSQRAAGSVTGWTPYSQSIALVTGPPMPRQRTPGL